MRVIAILIASLLLCPEAWAATVESLQIQGSPVVTEADVLTVGRIPDSVIDLFHQKGGRVLYVSSPLERRCGVDYKVYGMYCPGSRKIYIRSGAELGGTVAHELGHFLWCETRPSWPADIRETFPDPEEFAETYCNYCRFGGADAAINSIHMTVEKLSERGKL